MTLYAETSAIVGWLLGEPSAAAVRGALAGAEAIISSDLCLVECDRTLIRAETLREIAPAAASGRRRQLRKAAAGWQILSLGAEIVERARHRFPQEPIRTLDALHLACLLSAASVLPDVTLLSLDPRVRAAARAMGFGLQPD